MRRANAIAYQPNHVELPARDADKSRPTSRPSLLTPARRAGIDALEREFSELLAAYQSRRTAPTAAA
ncbi:MAG: hypothetical protein ACR2K5_01440 [Pseudolabrys sp.]